MSEATLAGRLTYAVAGQVDWLVRPHFANHAHITAKGKNTTDKIIVQ